MKMWRSKKKNFNLKLTEKKSCKLRAPFINVKYSCDEWALHDEEPHVYALEFDTFSRDCGLYGWIYNGTFRLCINIQVCGRLAYSRLPPTTTISVLLPSVMCYRTLVIQSKYLVVYLSIQNTVSDIFFIKSLITTRFFFASDKSMVLADDISFFFHLFLCLQTLTINVFHFILIRLLSFNKLHWN